MNIVHLLPDSVANQIAAGEVIQRPASVIKELVENAIDAGASDIDVVVYDAGRTSIQVVDNGKGMSEVDARLALERHATSKISKAEDLFTLHTMGFRGEALPSIVAVSQVTIKTRTADSEIGTCLEVEGSQVKSQEPCACPTGTNFEVRNLFFNIPARRKFLKSNQTELNNIIQEFQRIALVNHSVGFTLRNGDTIITRLLPTSRKQRILDIFGKSLSSQMVEIHVDTSVIKIDGYIGRPESSRKRGAHQYFFVNGRFMRHSYFHKAIMDAYDQLIPTGEQTPYFIYFNADPSTVDVNISPTKTEIKFENEPAIWQVIMAGVKESLGRFHAVPPLDFDTEGSIEIPTCKPDTSISSEYLPKPPRVQKTSVSDWQKLYADLSATLPRTNASESTLFPEMEEELQPRLEIGEQFLQYHGRYIVFTSSEGLVIVNQQRAHTRILYDRFLRQIKQSQVVTQGLLFPEMIELSPSESHIMETLEDELRNLGFDIVPLGGGSYSINGLPPDIEGWQPKKLIHDILESVTQGGEASLVSEVHHKMALSLAHNLSIVEGQALSNQEMQHLITELFQCENSNYTPDGKTIFTRLDVENMEKMFF